jgi:hypothetical protein
MSVQVPFQPLSRKVGVKVKPPREVVVVLVVLVVVVVVVAVSAGATVPFQPLSLASAGATPPKTTALATRMPANHLAAVRFRFIIDLVL